MLSSAAARTPIEPPRAIRYTSTPMNGMNSANKNGRALAQPGQVLNALADRAADLVRGDSLPNLRIRAYAAQLAGLRGWAGTCCARNTAASLCSRQPCAAE